MFYKAGLLLFAGRKTLLQKFSEFTNWQRTRWGTSSTWKTMLLCINILSNLLRKVSSLFQDILSMKVSDYACLPKTIEISSLLKADVRSTRFIFDLSNLFHHASGTKLHSKKFECDVCGRMLSRKFCLRRHMKTFHGNSWIKTKSQQQPYNSMQKNSQRPL